MAEADDGQERTEEPTPKRREDARAEGRIVTSKELFVFTGIAAATLALMTLGGLLEGAAGRWAEGLVIPRADRLDTAIAAQLGVAVNTVLLAGLAAGVPLLAVTLMTQAAAGGLGFAPKALGFKPDKMDPLKGLGRMVSAKSAVELGKAVLKVVFLIGAAGFVLIDLLPALTNLSAMAPGDGMAVFGDALVRVLSAMALVLGAIAGLDLLWQIHTHNQGLRMTREEVKQESKDQEGKPEVKAQIRRRQYEASRRATQRAALKDVPRATAIVTNPTHFAVALRYVPSEMDSPVILAMGEDRMAQEIIRLGRRAGVTIVGAPPLARALYFTGRIGAEIRVDLYAAVATLLGHVWRLDHGLREATPDFDLPPDLQLDQYGRPIRKGPTA